jgi:hypothetical protein
VSKIDKIVNWYNYLLPVLKGGEQKVIWVILMKTWYFKKVNCAITNEEFSIYGAHLTKSRDIIKATNDLVDRGIIFKVKDTELELMPFRYMINDKFCISDKEVTGEKVV